MIQFFKNNFLKVLQQTNMSSLCAKQNKTKQNVLLDDKIKTYFTSLEYSAVGFFLTLYHMPFQQSWSEFYSHA